MTYRVTVTEALEIRRSPEEVFDFTQDYGRRRDWDAAVLEAEVLTRHPVPRVRVRAAGGFSGVFQYRQFERPVRTSLAIEDAVSPLIEGGGGSWSYEACSTGTLWTQTNTLLIKAGWWRRLLVPLVRAQLLSGTRRSMSRAKTLLESPA